MNKQTVMLKNFRNYFLFQKFSVFATLGNVSLQPSELHKKIPYLEGW